ncbi:23S rRNA (adenine(2503)-C(2))-methyltransferase RlmN [Loigolactobacillus binensis]|uniref:Probable dual-specificity RNA methyltransferase RlmN n=1 Tax=Loigolactobacillus binensis TaxID=2559922 RepID=A0ABW3ECY6_9LACO|nr:23S rRNA (adenine(2503)-C(2))-methyltransferase RlmN [Loigolactobacillus binensis]
MAKTSIYGLNKQDLIDWFIEHGDKKFRATQAWDWLYIKRVTSFAAMTNLSKATIALLEENFDFTPLKSLVVQESKDGETAKYLFELEDKLMIETVLMRHDYGLSVCVTTQVGCNIGCTFCASGLVKKQRDLTAGEIVAQVVQIQRHLDEKGEGERVSHIVVMGIGEPFDNFDNVMKFLEIVNDQKGLEIGARHITVSTSGLANKIRDFADRDTQVNLAISLHAPNDELRSKIMRINRTWNLDKLFAAVHYYLAATNRRITFEYIMLNDVNDHPEEALQLAALLKNIRHLAYVNLIPYNPVAEHDQYSRSPKKHVMAFYDTLKKQGINVQIRREFGTEIDAACGQLRTEKMKELDQLQK